ncbi:sulfate transporter family-domain-containing protein [Polychytrium aggregatum]|uniref:sulfate transporter family-domain-containing protein n=1 Tax=Polychytrium aggregatum TaxID=110093 RepID=UPI0022FE8205|nr:sulfate transporter family-domain-containing protein [Polychytrium aggregatum]KAI9190749.1 sulfate transporter family-domain-containing protein [Polychytrium aggregatum]
MVSQALRKRSSRLSTVTTDQRRQAIASIHESYGSHQVGALEEKLRALRSSFTREHIRSWVYTSFPIIPQILSYNLKLFGEDIVAAVTIAFVLIPQSIAYSTLAQVQPIRALLSSVFPVVIYAIFGQSRQLSVGPEALSSVLVGVTVLQESQNGYSTDQLASSLAFLVGVFLLILSALQAGFIDNILSGYLLTGFVTGVASLIMVEQLPELLGINDHPAGELSTIQKLTEVCNYLSTTNFKTLACSIVSIAFLLSIQTIKKKYGHKSGALRLMPQILLLVIIMISVSAAADFNSMGIHILGRFNNQISPPTLPPLSFPMIQRLVYPTIILTIVGFVESQTVTKKFGLKNEYSPSGNRELFALGIANLVGSFMGCYVTFGSLPRSKILAVAGGRTTLAGLFAAILVLIAFVTLVPVLQFLPKSTLASIVFVAAYNLIEWGEIIFVFKIRGWIEVALFLIAWALTLATTISDGIVLCLLLASLIIFRHTTIVNMSVLGWVPNGITNDSGYFVDTKEHPEAELFDNVLIMKIEAPIMFYNCGTLQRKIDLLIRAEQKLALQHAREVNPVLVGGDSTLGGDTDLRGSDTDLGTVQVTGDDHGGHNPHYILIDLKNSTDMDSAAIHMLKVITRSFKRRKFPIYFTGLHDFHIVLFRRSGLLDLVGSEHIFDTIQEGIHAIDREVEEEERARGNNPPTNPFDQPDDEPEDKDAAAGNRVMLQLGHAVTITPN